MLFLKRIVRTKLDIYVFILSHYLYIGNRCLILFQKEIYNHYMWKSCLKLRIHVLRQGRLLWYVMKSNPAHGEVYSTQQYVIKFVSDLRLVGGFLLVLPFLHQLNGPPRYNWNIVESDAKHHNPNPQIFSFQLFRVDR